MAKILFIDHHDLLRPIFGQFLRRSLPAFEFFEAKSLNDIQKQILENKFSVILIAVHPDKYDYQIYMDAVRSKGPLILIAPHALDTAQRLLQSQTGKLLSSESNEEALINAIRLSAQNTVTHTQKNNKNPIDSLSKRELEVFTAIAQGHKPQRIAQILGIETTSIKTYRDRIKTKTLCKSDAEIVFMALKTGIISTI